MNTCQKIKNVATKIWRKFRIRKNLPEPRTLVSIEYGFYCAVARISRKSRGDGFRIIADPKCGNWDIIITLDLLSHLGGNLPGLRDSTNRNLQYQEKNNHQTHRFAVFRCGSDGRIIPWHIWDVNLCGDRSINSYFVQNATQRAIKGVAHKALFISHRPEKTYYMTWQGQIERMNWIGVLEQESRWHLADQFHDLKEVKIYGEEDLW